MTSIRCVGACTGLVLLLAACSGTSTGTGQGDGGAGAKGDAESGFAPTPSQPDGGPDAGCGGLSFKDPTCNTCMQGSCCAALTSCGSNTSCQELLGCLQQCANGNTTCESNCQTTYSGGVSDLNAVGSCFSGPCATSCPQ